MKILALIGSYRKNGNTSQVVGLVCGFFSSYFNSSRRARWRIPP